MQTLTFSSAFLAALALLSTVTAAALPETAHRLATTPRESPFEGYTVEEPVWYIKTPNYGVVEVYGTIQEAIRQAEQIDPDFRFTEDAFIKNPLPPPPAQDGNNNQGQDGKPQDASTAAPTTAVRRRQNLWYPHEWFPEDTIDLEGDENYKIPHYKDENWHDNPYGKLPGKYEEYFPPVVDNFTCWPEGWVGAHRASLIDHLESFSRIWDAQPPPRNGPYRCGRVACEHKAAVWWCNDNPYELELRNWRDFNFAIEIAIKECRDWRRPGWGLTPFERVAALIYYKGNYTIRLLEDDTYC